MGNTVANGNEGDLSGVTRALRNSKNSRAVDKEVSKALASKARIEQSTIKLLLLGAGESGKTTVLKQMTLRHGGGFTKDYKDEMKPKICFNVIEGAVNVIKATTKLKHPLSNPETLEAAERVVDYFNRILGHGTELTPQIVQDIKLLWQDEDFRATFAESSKFQIQDGWEEFAERLNDYPTWGGPKWIPNEEDILLSRVRTTGIVEQYYTIDNVRFRMLDVGGQRSERRKWMVLFEGVTGIIFVASLSEYNQTLFEDSSTNRLVESLKLWEEHANRKGFEDTALVLFLNKFDLFQKKFYYDKTPIEAPIDCDPINYPIKPPLPKDEVDEKCDLAIKWYKNLFLSRVRVDKQPMVYMYVTTALDPNHMGTVIDACASHILQQNMKQSGLVPSYV